MSELYLRYEYIFAALQLASAMVGMGARLHIRDFLEVFRQPRSFLFGLATQLIVVPLIALLISNLFELSTGLTIGLILVAAVPGGTMSNVITYFAKGNIALSIALTAVTTLACLVTTPFVMQLLAAEILPGEFAMPAGSIAFDIFIVLLVPLAVGMLIGTVLPRQRIAISNWAIRLSLFVISLMIIGAVGAGRIDPASQGTAALAATGLFAVLAQLAVLLPNRLLGLSSVDAAAIAIEVTIRNTNLALLIKASVFPVIAGVPDPVADGVLFVALLYGGFALPVALPLVIAHRRYASRH
jgi:BASS family bile acid:Na+ symporter